MNVFHYFVISTILEHVNILPSKFLFALLNLSSLNVSCILLASLAWKYMYFKVLFGKY